MNKNTLARFNEARKLKHKGQKSSTFSVPKILDGRGENASWGNYGYKTFNFEEQPRLSTKPKVAGKGKRTKTEIQSESEQLTTNIVVSPKKDLFVQE